MFVNQSFDRLYIEGTTLFSWADMVSMYKQSHLSKHQDPDLGYPNPTSEGPQRIPNSECKENRNTYPTGGISKERKTPKELVAT